MTLPFGNDTSGKKEQVEQMFNQIAHKYDFLNHLLSFGIDKRWRKKLVDIIARKNPLTILDIATGTGDLAITAAKNTISDITGIDISDEMLLKGIEKINKQNLSGKINLVKGDSEHLTFHNNKFDAVIVAFGVRNFENLKLGLAEMFRVLKPDGTVAILEFSKPKGAFFKKIYSFYFQKILPLIGKYFSKNNFAYVYLPESVLNFPEGEDFLKILSSVGFKNLNSISLTFGIASIYTGEK